MGFIATEVNQSLYIFQNEETIITIWIHVDDGVVASNSVDAVSSFKNALCAELNIKWSDVVQQIVGLKCAIGEGEVTTAQWRLTDSILDTYLRPILQRDSPLPMLPAGGLMMDAEILVRDWISSLAGGINICPKHLSLSLWSDAGWGGDLERLQAGFVIKLGDTPILWGSKRQAVVALSTCAMEYVALSDSTQHFVQAINQLTQLAGNFNKTIFCDNQAAVQVSIYNKSRKRMCYLDRAFFFVNDTIQKHNIKVVWVKTTDMQANALTKQLLGPVLLQALPFLGITG
ncbi:hypothetical protein O181_066675 [Austropuccinia psidii MF-1]|uniref:Reverse transcriptase Ty1/copia-type domain-containing protein n=1 Tax=Austropuccinia psidii MF-1 TaxID=1389203 RepID=A0A9Q3I5B9_9BASI|nr:hypothetical protein [Austropuccinia psidii MF-1]